MECSLYILVITCLGFFELFWARLPDFYCFLGDLTLLILPYADSFLELGESDFLFLSFYWLLYLRIFFASTTKL